MGLWYEIFSVILTSSVKFFAGPILAKSLGFSYLNTVIVSSVGGVVGVFVFFNLGTRIVNFFPNFFKPIKKKKRVFTKKNKFFVNVIRNYGLFGLSIFTPVLISIPVGAFLAARFFQNQKNTALLIMSISVLLWSVSISSFLFLV
jgi:uncharacterized membrane protein